MIQDIAPIQFSNRYELAEPAPGDPVFCFDGRRLLVRIEDGHYRLPTASLFRTGELQFLFRLDAQPYFPLMTGERTAREGFSYEKLHLMWDSAGETTALPGEGLAAMTAYHLYTWYGRRRYCGRCGARMEPGRKERSMICRSCGCQEYPMIAPAVIVGVTDGDRILMTRYAGREYKGVALIAGFCEIGESAEDTVRREVMEEVGLHVKNIRYYDSQPWGVDSNLLLGYYCQLDDSRGIHMDREELSAARWVSRDELNAERDRTALTAQMIWHFKHHPEDFE